MNMVALGRVVLTRREHVIALEPKDRGLLGLTLRFPYEVRDQAAYFEDIPELKLPKEMLDLATHIVNTKSGHFDPAQFEDRYENALVDLLKKKEAGEKIEPVEAGPAPRVVNLMDALRACRPGSGWNWAWRILREREGIVSCCEVNRLIAGLYGERLPSIDLPHVDLSRGEQRPEQHGCGVC